ncbi:DedA family protein [Nocardioides limicola]|uniref:DedA family protein n=1 Tax=Nocardioides limicola TaxID=2803368 RepID=UPI0027DE97FD|nr:VTT domain-containing protein [Nocardioides sp. DJM-14]
MPEFVELIPMVLGMDWMDPTWLLDQFGAAFFWVCLAIIFIECGLLFPFLPGDTLLFAVGLFVATGRIDLISDSPLIDLAIALVLMAAAAFAGNVVGYEIGSKVGPPLYQRDGRILKRKYFDSTHLFFERHGSAALIIGRFFAFVRTFVTVVAGATNMDRRRFWLFSFIGAVIWVVSITTLGYFLGRSVPSLGENLELAMLAILVFFAIPLVWEGVRHRRAKARG